MLNRKQTVVSLCFALILGIKLICVATYPGNIGGDAAWYWRLTVEWRSTLVHAHGYPFLMGLVYKEGLVEEKAKQIISDIISAPDKNLVVKLDPWTRAYLRDELKSGVPELALKAIDDHTNIEVSVLELTKMLTVGLPQDSIKLVQVKLENALRLMPSYKAKNDRLRKLIFFQQMIDFCMLIALYSVIAGLFDWKIAALTVLLYGCNMANLSDCSSIRPEWLQADLLIFSLFFAWRGFLQTATRGKSIYYSVSAISFLFAYLTKFNCLIFILFFIPLIWLEYKRDRKRTINSFIIVAMSTLVVYSSYMVGFHYRSTGTFSQTGMKSWVLLGLSPAANLVKPDNGLQSKRYLTLVLRAKEVIRQYEQANQGKIEGVTRIAPTDLWGQIEPVNLEFWQENNGFYQKVMHSTGAELDSLISSFPDRSYQTSDFSPATIVFGVKAIEQLSQKVFLEAILANTYQYVCNVGRNLGRAFLIETDEPSYPVFKDLGWPWLKHPFGIERPGESDRFGNDYFSAGVIRSRPIAYYNPVIMWEPGVSLFSLLRHMYIPGLLRWIFVCMLLALCAKRIFTGMNRSREKLLLAAILLLIFYIATFVTYHPFRYKEFRLISPVVYSLDAIFLIELFKTVKNLLYRQLGPE